METYRPAEKAGSHVGNPGPAQFAVDVEVTARRQFKPAGVQQQRHHTHQYDGGEGRRLAHEIGPSLGRQARPGGQAQPVVLGEGAEQQACRLRLADVHARRQQAEVIEHHRAQQQHWHHQHMGEAPQDHQQQQAEGQARQPARHAHRLGEQPQVKL